MAGVIAGGTYSSNYRQYGSHLIAAQFLKYTRFVVLFYEYFKTA